jgi:tRNA threonylcarbamoyladenosine biosynthesis protein TsaB
MALILSIDTAMENAGLCIAENENILSFKTNSRQTDHAAWMHNAIKEALQDAGKKMEELNAVSVTSGPGSYTGLRVGMASAKGLCYVLNIPFIAESTLHLTAYSVKKNINDQAWICPMIDARRMEVFTTVYDEQLLEQLEPAAMILDEYSFQHILDQHEIVFCGNGSVKWGNICHHSHAVFSNLSYKMSDLAIVSSMKYAEGNFTDIAYSEPSYLKNFYMGTKDA